jgi:purine nucleoside permease
MLKNASLRTYVIWRFGILFALVSCAVVPRTVAAATASPVRVMILVAAAWQEPSGEWRGEAERWVVGYRLTRKLAVPGLSQPVLCNEAGVCLAVVGEGPVASAGATMALGLYPGLDLTKAYFLIAGIAGAPPYMATLGTVSWADWIVDADAVATIDRADLPDGWPFTRYRKFCPQPWCEDSWGIGAVRLNAALVKRATAVSAATPLLDSEKARAYAGHYTGNEPASHAPSVISCSSLAGATYWHGPRLSDWARWWVDRWTSGNGRYCMTDEEDFAIVTTLERLSSIGKVDRKRVLVLRGASNFDQPQPGQPAVDSLHSMIRTKNDGYRLAIENVWRVGTTFVQDVVGHWPAWQDGVPGRGRER